jgi:hypothetical protein
MGFFLYCAAGIRPITRFSSGNSKTVLFGAGLGLSRSLSYGFIARWREKGKLLNPAGFLIRVKGGDRLREASWKFQANLCHAFPDEN